MASDSAIPVATREIRAARPYPDREALRAAYLELLKLTLCDLAGARTLSIGRTWRGRPFTRELAGEQLKLRSAGLDWPLSGLTMIGLSRLDDVQRCAEAVVRDGVEGDLIEAGAWRGGASILLRATLDSLGATDRTVWVADTFEGFPVPDANAYPADRERDLHTLDFLAAPLDEVRAHFARFALEDGVRFLPGLFQDTLPRLRDHRWALVRLDGDTYESTWAALSSLYPRLSVGGYLLVDDYKLIDECRQAVDDFRARHEISEPLEDVDWNAVHWRREDGRPIPAPPLPDATFDGEDRSRRLLDRHAGEKIPSLREIRLERQLQSLRERLAAEGKPPAAERKPAPFLHRAAARIRSRLARTR
jgi:O-methyltransferase